MLKLDCSFIDRWRRVYDQKNQGTFDQIEEDAILGWLALQKGVKYLNKAYFLRIGLWKTPRYSLTRKNNAGAIVMNSTKSAYMAANDSVKLNLLKNNLNGVGTAVASTLLYYLQPDKFPIFDYHVRNTLIKANILLQSENKDTVKVWLKYTKAIRQLAVINERTIRETEKALFAYDKYGSATAGVQIQPPKSSGGKSSIITNNVPASQGWLKAVLHESDKNKWEIFVGNHAKYSKYGTSASELSKIPGYPVTHLVQRYGIEMELHNGNNKCAVAFHGFDANNRYGKHIYLGSASRLCGPTALLNYKNFLKSVFVLSNAPIAVGIKFNANSKVDIR